MSNKLTTRDIWNRKWKELKAVESAVIQRHHSRGGPRTGRAVLISMAVFVFVFFAPALFGVLGIDLLPRWEPGRTWNPGAAWVTFAVLTLPVSYHLVLRFSSLSRYWTEEIDKLLAQYDPIDGNAYHYLQKKTRELGYIDGYEIRIWLGLERSAIEVAAGWHDPSEYGFLSKAVDVAKESPASTPAPSINADWVAHAYPLQQFTIKLQGTRHSDKAAIVAQLETVLARLNAGDTSGREHDDDFGYAFKYVQAVDGPSFFDEPFGSE